MKIANEISKRKFPNKIFEQNFQTKLPKWKFPNEISKQNFQTKILTYGLDISFWNFIEKYFWKLGIESLSQLRDSDTLNLVCPILLTYFLNCLKIVYIFWFGQIYLVSTLKFQFEKNDKFNNITWAMLNASLISTLKYEKIKCFWVIQEIWKNKKINNKKKSEKTKLFERFAQQTQRPPTWKTAEIELWLSAAGFTCV